MTAAPIDPHSLDRHPEPKRALYFMRALGVAGLPDFFELGGISYRLTESIKHDFFAATGFYVSEHGSRVVLKIGRVAPFLGVPMQWIGRLLRRRELRFYGKLSDLPNIPAILGTVGTTGFVHAYVEGSPLCRGSTVPDHFFDELKSLLDEVHRRGIAYVDTNKPQNILLGADGRPHLIDFQISWDLDEFGNWFGNRWLLRRMQEDDYYHLLKHKRRLRRDEMTPAETERVHRRGLVIRVHRMVCKPYFVTRRFIFRWLRTSGRLMPEGSE